MKNKNVIRIAINAMIVAIIAIMSFVPYVGYITIPPGTISFTIIHIAVLIFAWMFGWREGLVAGLAFGVFSLVKAATMPNTPIDVYFVNPMISILPRMVFGFFSGLAFDLLRKVKKPAALRFWLDVIMCAVMTIIHSILTLSMLYIFAGDREALQGFSYITLIFTIISFNGLIEVGGASVLTPIIILPLDRAFPKYEAIYHSTLKSRKKQSVYEAITQSYRNPLMENLAKFVSIKSVLDEETISKTDPFGKGVSEALDFIASLAKSDGFKVTNYANKVVEITCGEGKNITILAHADVVPAGTGWDQNPFEMVDRGDRVTGRGVADDKGPLLAAYYAMKAVRDNHMMGDYQIRFIVGGNEESGSAGVEYYFQKLKKPQPDFGFSPDAEFPLIFAEKGIMNFEVKKKINLKHVDSIKGGVASNSVIEQCVVVLDYDRDFIKFLVDHKYDADYVQSSLDKLTVTFHGKAAHGSTPEQGFNAGMQAIKCIANYFSDKDLLHLYDKYKNVQGYDLEAFGNSEEMGHNTLNVGIINYEDKQFSMIVNFRYVDKCDVDDLLFHIKEHSKPFTVNVLGNSKLLYYPKESELVLTLLRAYQYETGDFKSQPMAIGGGTYAKEANNVVAFGMEFPGWNSHMHSPGEQAKKADLFKSMSIYARAIIELGRLLENKNEN